MAMGPESLRCGVPVRQSLCAAVDRHAGNTVTERPSYAVGFPYAASRNQLSDSKNRV
jgi:hypothetical protein